MSQNIADLSRREFLRTSGVVGLGSMLSTFGSLSYAQELTDAKESKQIVVPTRPFGKTGAKISILALGVASYSTSSHILLKQGLKFGVNYWDTANSYSGGQSERSIGKFFKNTLRIGKSISGNKIER